jgi:protein-S-isoprenylcysteine O-methyltransferase Ste14
MSASVNSRPGSAWAMFQRGTKAYDVLAASPLIAWYVLSLYITVPVLVHGFATMPTVDIELRQLLRLLSSVTKFGFALLLICLLVARRTPIAGSDSFAPKFIAFLGGYLPVGLLILPGRTSDSHLLLLSSFLIFAGMVFAVYSLAYLGRSVSVLPESRKLVTGGPYAVVRHPLYLGEQIALMGVVLQAGSMWAVGAIVLQFGCQLYRMNCEEKILSGSFPEYSAYMASTYRLIPGLY